MQVASADAEVVKRGALQLSVALSDQQVSQLCEYASLVRRWNQKFNLVSRRDKHPFVARHILDSLTLCPWLVGPDLLDLGSGAGLPGVPLAVAHPSVRVVLLDRSARRSRFLSQVARTLMLDNVRVHCGDARDAAQLGRFATVVARAVAATEQVWTLAEPLLAADGAVLLMRSTDARRDPAPAVPGAVLRSHRVRVPGLAGEREILSMNRAA